ncbi:MAG: GNAT family N-acetyltransferase [Oscillospiraceae bacterium]|jgi:predicted N-acetyltransferase YhbS|nr:GNAT family N-acetyltransferase [Oscillospiraceae bacterium]
MTLQILSLRDNPELIGACHGLVRDWFFDFDVIHKQLDDTLSSLDKLPQAYVLTDGGAPVGWVGLCVNDPIETDEYTPIVGPLMIAESERNRGYGALLLYHARRAAATLGFDTVYLTSSHVGYYERFGFREIGMTRYIGGKPTKVYTAQAIKEN